MPHYAEGVYTVEVTGQGLNESKTKHTPGFYLKVVPDGQMYERTIQWWITDGTVENVLRDLRKLGFSGTSWSQLDPEYEGYHKFVGQEIQAVCKWEENDGKTYERWELPYEGKPIEITKLNRKGARKLDSLFGKQFKAAFNGVAETQQTASQEPQEPLTAANMAEEAAKAAEDDDQVPF